MVFNKPTDSYSVGLWLAVLSAFGFSFKAILVKLAYGVPQVVPVDAVTLLTLRMLFALPFFLWFSWSSRKTGGTFTTRDRTVILALGVIGYYAASIFDFLGLCYISAGLERIILFTYPILTLFFEIVFFKKTIHNYERAAVLICFVGIAFAFTHDLGVTDQQAHIWLGSGLVMLSAICYAVYLSGGGYLIARYGSVRFASLVLIVSSLATVTHFIAVHPLSDLVQPWEIYLLALAMSLFSTVIPVFALAAAIRRVGSAPAALIGSIGPVLTIGFGWLLLGEAISIMQLGGAALVVGGILIVGGGRKQRTSRGKF